METSEDLDALALQQLASKRAHLARLHAENAALRSELAALHSHAAKGGAAAAPALPARLLLLAQRACGLAPPLHQQQPPPPPPRRLNSLSLLLHLVGLALLFVPLGGGGGALQGSSSAGGGAPRAPAPVDLVLLVPTTAANHQLHAAVRAQFHRGGAAAAAAAAGTAALVLVHGGSGSGSGSVAGEELGAPECGDGPLALPNFNDQPGHSWRYHTYSHFTCKLMAGLCAATRAYAPRYVAVASEEALFRWAEFMRARAPALPQRGLVFTRYIEKELHRDGLPPSYWNKAWPVLPTFNNSVVLSRDVADTLCTLHSTGKLLLYGPPELFLGGILSTLEGLSWVMEQSVALGSEGEGSAPCSAGVTVTGFKGAEDWARCPKG